jgi:hypothetical protein
MTAAPIVVAADATPEENPAERCGSVGCEPLGKRHVGLGDWSKACRRGRFSGHPGVYPEAAAARAARGLD